jgi:hypothetical protein
MIAGSWCLQNDFVPTDVDAEIFLSVFAFKKEDHSNKEHRKCVDTILQVVPKELNGVSISEKIIECIVTTDNNASKNVLARYGIGISRDKDRIYFSPKHIMMKSCLKETQYYDTYSAELLRLEDAKIDRQRIIGKLSQVVSIPTSVILEDYDLTEYQYAEPQEMF